MICNQEEYAAMKDKLACEERNMNYVINQQIASSNDFPSLADFIRTAYQERYERIEGGNL